MPPLTSIRQNDYAVLWELSTRGDYGEPVVSSPIEIRCRWEEVQSESLNAEGTPIKLDASLVLTRDVEIGSILRLGKLVDLPSPPDNLFQVIAKESVADLKSLITCRSLSLMRYSQALPDVVGTGT